MPAIAARGAGDSGARLEHHDPQRWGQAQQVCGCADGGEAGADEHDVGVLWEGGGARVCEGMLWVLPVGERGAGDGEAWVAGHALRDALRGLLGLRFSGWSGGECHG